MAIFYFRPTLISEPDTLIQERTTRNLLRRFQEGVWFPICKKFNLQAMSNVLTVKLNTEEDERKGGKVSDPTLAVFLMR